MAKMGGVRLITWIGITLLILLILIFIIYYLYDRRYKASIDERLSTPSHERRQILIDLNNIIAEAALKSDTRPFIIYGTLLGYERDRDLICYDFDLDFGISEDEYDAVKGKVMEILQSRPEYRVDIKDFLHYRSIEIIHKTTRISADISTFTMESDDGATVSRSVPSIYSLYYLKECAANMPREWIYPLQQVDFLGNRTYIPNHPSKLLECYYGPNYMTPNKVCDRECNQCVTKE